MRTVERALPYAAANTELTVEERLTRLESRARRGRVVFIVGIGCILAAIVAAFLDGAAGFWPHVKNYLGW